MIPDKATNICWDLSQLTEDLLIFSSFKFYQVSCGTVKASLLENKFYRMDLERENLKNPLMVLARIGGLIGT